MEVTFSKMLGHKVSFMNPLFIVDLDLKEQEVTGGWDNKMDDRPSGVFDYRNFIKNDDIRLRLNYGLRRISKNGILMIRKIFYDRNIWYNALEKYVDFDTAEDKTLDNEVKDTLGDFPIVNEFGQNTTNKLIIRMYNPDTSSHAKSFLEAWSSLMYKISHRKHNLYTVSDMNDRASKHGFKLVEQHTPRTMPENNPLFVTYLLYEKK